MHTEHVTDLFPLADGSGHYYGNMVDEWVALSYH